MRWSGRKGRRKIKGRTRNDEHAAEVLVTFNATAHTARTLWIFFLTLMAYLLVSLASVTHVDLLLNKPLRLPILQVDIGLKGFFSFAPAILIIIHFGLLIQFVMLARKADALSSLLHRQEGAGLDHPLRMRVSSYFYAQQLA